MNSILPRLKKRRCSQCEQDATVILAELKDLKTTLKRLLQENWNLAEQNKNLQKILQSEQKGGAQ